MKIINEKEEQLKVDVAQYNGEEEALLVLQKGDFKFRLGRLRKSRRHLISNKGIGIIQTITLMYLAYEQYGNGDKRLMMFMILLYAMRRA